MLWMGLEPGPQDGRLRLIHWRSLINASTFQWKKLVKTMDNSTLPSGRTATSCGQFGDAEFNQIDACGFWVEGVAMTVSGIFALITNAISIYVFSRYNCLTLLPPLGWDSSPLSSCA